MKRLRTLKEAEKQFPDIITFYYKDGAKNLQKLSHKILQKLRFDVEYSDFDSLADEIFLDVLCRYDSRQNFHGFLYSCLKNKFKSEMSKRTAMKRKMDNEAMSLDAPIDEDNAYTISDVVKSSYDTEMMVENIIVHDIIDCNAELINMNIVCSDSILQYVQKLSKLQRRILIYLVEGHTKQEIMKLLQITENMYMNNIQCIRATENVKILY